MEQLPPTAPPNWQEIYSKLLARIAELEAEIKALKEKLNTNSRNSSKPPSQDPFRPKRKSKPSGKKQGGQPGHKGHARKMYPTDEVSEIVDLKPHECSSCGCSEFDQAPTSVECRQVVELPSVNPEVTQYNIYTHQCTQCGQQNRAEVPKEAERGFGPRLMGFLTMLSGEAGVTKRKICSIASHLGIEISLGALCNIHRLAAEVLKQPYEEIRTAVLEQRNVNADETSWRLKSKKCWIWIGATPQATFFSIDPRRSREAFERIFRTFKNILSSDRYGAYNSYEGLKQDCLAHIDRDFEKLSERRGADGAIGRILCDQLGSIFGLWQRFKDQEISRKELQDRSKVYVDNIKTAITVLASAREVQSKSQSLGKNLLKRFSNLWVFLYEEGVEPTNNLAERGLRPAVIWRKISGGNQSEWGLDFTERLLTIACTLKQQGGNIFEFLTKAFKAHIQAQSPPVVFDSS